MYETKADAVVRYDPVSNTLSVSLTTEAGVTISLDSDDAAHNFDIHTGLLTLGMADRNVVADPSDVALEEWHGRCVEQGLLSDSRPASDIVAQRRSESPYDCLTYGGFQREVLTKWMDANGYPEQLKERVLYAPLHREDRKQRSALSTFGGRSVEDVIRASLWLTHRDIAIHDQNTHAGRSERSKDSFVKAVLTDELRPFTEYSLSAVLSVMTSWFRPSNVSVGEVARAALIFPEYFYLIQRSRPSQRGSDETHSGLQKVQSFYNRQEKRLDALRKAGDPADAFSWLTFAQCVNRRFAGEASKSKDGYKLALECAKNGVSPAYAKFCVEHGITDPHIIHMGFKGNMDVDLLSVMANNPAA